MQHGIVRYDSLFMILVSPYGMLNQICNNLYYYEAMYMQRNVFKRYTIPLFIAYCDAL